MSGSDEITRLVSTVKHLPRADQHRILRLVELMIRAPAGAQQRTQAQLRELLAQAPASHEKCIDAIDNLITELENSMRSDDCPLRDEDGQFGLRIFPGRST